MIKGKLLLTAALASYWFLRRRGESQGANGTEVKFTAGFVPSILRVRIPV